MLLLRQSSNSSSLDISIEDESVLRREPSRQKTDEKPGEKILTVRKMVHGSPNFAAIDEPPVPSAVGELQGEGSCHC